MSFRQSGQSDDRRRRVLRDDSAKRPTRESASSSEEGADKPASGKVERPEGAFRRIDRPKTAKRRAYNAAALVEGQLRLIDLIPVRAWTLSVLILLVLTAISGQAVLYLQWPKWGRWLGRENLAFVDLSTRDSLAGWFSAMLLAIAACQCLFIYSLRRYRADDYRGRYRIWLSACAIVLLASADAVAGWGRGLCGLATHLGAIGGNISPESCGRLVWTIVFAVGAGRMLFEMRRSLAAVAWLLVAGACYAGSLVLLSPGFNVAPNQLTSLGRAVCLLLGHATLLFTALFYARRVFLEAHGHIAAPLAGASTGRRRKSGSGKKATSTRRTAETKPASDAGKVANAKTEVVEKKDEKKPPALATKPAAVATPSLAKPQATTPTTATSATPGKSAAATPTAAAPTAAAPSAAKPAAAKPAEAAPTRLSPLARLLGKGKAAAAENNSKKADEKSPQNEKPVAKPVPASAAKPGLHVKSIDADEDEDDEQDAGDGSSKLSKAERRRLKKEQRRDRRAAA